MAGWQSGDAEDCKSFYVGSIPVPASKPVTVPVRPEFQGRDGFLVIRHSSTVEHATVNRRVVGSNPTVGAKNFNYIIEIAALFWMAFRQTHLPTHKEFLCGHFSTHHRRPLHNPHIPDSID